MGMIKQSLCDKSEEVLSIISKFSGCLVEETATVIAIDCTDPETAANLAQTINNRAIPGTKVITHVLFPLDVYVRFNLS